MFKLLFIKSQVARC